MNDNALFVLEAILILALPYVVWHVGRLRALVPCAVIQIALGVLLGPSGLGQVSPSLYADLFSASNLSKISGIASFSVLLFAFITGLHLDLDSYRKDGARSLAAGGASSIVVPLVLGVLVGWWMFDTDLAGVHGGVERWRFALAIGIAMSVTALPVLGAILREMNLLQAPLGQWVLSLAAINDAVLWILVSALFVPVGEGALAFVTRFALILGYFVFMFAGLKPILKRAFAKDVGSDVGDATLVAMATVALASALLSDLVGLHLVVGAFAAGAVMPDRLRAPLLRRMEGGVAALLTPFFFMNAGLHVRLDLTSSAFVQIVVVTTAAAVVGKVVGAGVPAILSGKPYREGLAIGALMQTKGLMEVVVLTILREAGLIDASVFSALIVMAILTTAMAMPFAKAALTLTFGREPGVENERLRRGILLSRRAL